MGLLLPLESQLRFRHFFCTPLPPLALLDEEVVKRAQWAAIVQDDVSAVNLFRGDTPDSKIFNVAFMHGSLLVLDSLDIEGSQRKELVHTLCRCQTLTQRCLRSFQWAGTTAKQLKWVLEVMLLFDPVEVLQELHKLLHFPRHLVCRHVDCSHVEFRHIPLLKLKWLHETFHIFDDPASRGQLTRRNDWEELARWFEAQ